MRTFRFCFLLFLGLAATALGCSNGSLGDTAGTVKPYPEEKAARISRGFIALPLENNQVLLMWRLFAADGAEASFEIYKGSVSGGKDEFLGATKRTFFIDTDPAKREVGRYKLVAKEKSRELLGAETEVALNAEVMPSYKTGLFFDLGENYEQARVVTGDLDGDGDLEVIVQFSNEKNLDPYEVFKKLRKSNDTVKVAAFLKNGMGGSRRVPYTRRWWCGILMRTASQRLSLKQILQATRTITRKKDLPS
jgi:hypothetical protein